MNTHIENLQSLVSNIRSGHINGSHIQRVGEILEDIVNDIKQYDVFLMYQINGIDDPGDLAREALHNLYKVGTDIRGIRSSSYSFKRD